MKSFLPLVLFHLLFIPMLFSQKVYSKVIIIDEDKVKYIIDEAVYLKIPEVDQLRGEQRRKLIERIKQIKMSYQLIQKRLDVWCISPEQYEQYIDYLQTLNKQILNYQTETKIIIANYMEWYDTVRTALVIDHVKQFCKLNQIDFAISKNKFRFQAEGFPDLTHEIIALFNTDKLALANEAENRFRAALSTLKEIDELYSTELLFYEWEYEGLKEESIEDIELEMEYLRAYKKN